MPDEPSFDSYLWRHAFLSVGDQLRLRFASLRRDPLFSELVEAYERAWDQDNDEACRGIERAMLAALRSYGQPTPSAICASCGRPRPELTRDYEEDCEACIKHHAENEQRRVEWEARWAAMSEVERDEHRRLYQMCIHGVITRDVQ